jgi:hypothetical protein
MRASPNTGTRDLVAIIICIPIYRVLIEIEDLEITRDKSHKMKDDSY